RRLERQAITLAAEEEKLAAEVGALGERIAEARGHLTGREEEHGQLEQRFDGAQADLVRARGEREEMRAAGAQHRGSPRLLDERLRAPQGDVERLEREARATEEQLARWAEEEQQLARKREELASSIETAEGDLHDALETRAGSQEEVIAAQQALDLQRESLRT